MKLQIEKGTAKGSISAPPSKSMSHRLLIAAGLSKGISTIKQISKCEDVLATRDCLASLGIRCEFGAKDVTVYGQDILKAKPEATLYCRESGSTLRFLVPVAMLSGNKTVFSGAQTLMARPMGIYKKLFDEKNLTYQEQGCKITLCGPLTGGKYTLAGDVSSQFISGLLFALPLLAGDSIIDVIPPVESKSYIDMTMSAVRTFGVEAIWDGESTIKVKGSQTYKPTTVTVESDASGAAFIDALNLFGSDVYVEGLNPNSLQPDAIYPTYFSQLNKGTPTISLKDCPDLGPILFALAAAKNGATFIDTNRLRIKESDRVDAMAKELKKFGTKITIHDNSVIIENEDFHSPSQSLFGHGDHRIVMALSILLSVVGGTIEGAQVVSKSYPDFFVHLKELGIKVQEI